mgnify:FL=1
MPKAITNRGKIAQAIIARVAAGEFLRDVCAYKGMPHPATFWEWVHGDADLASQWARARAMSALVEEGRVAALAQLVEDGEIEPDVARVAINARQWLAKIRDPKSYGDKLDVEHKGRIEVVPVLNITIAGPAPRIIEGESGDGE